MKIFILPLLLLVTSSQFSCAYHDRTRSGLGEAIVPAEESFSRMKSLVGTWKKASTDSDIFRIEFSLTANETVLVETWLNRGKAHSLTLYHRDGSNFLVTHYCPQGNQPRLKMVKSEQKEQVSFAFQDVTNLQGPNHSYQSSLCFELNETGNSMVRSETYSSEAGDNKSSLVLIRVR